MFKIPSLLSVTVTIVKIVPWISIGLLRYAAIKLFPGTVKCVLPPVVVTTRSGRNGLGSSSH